MRFTMFQQLCKIAKVKYLKTRNEFVSSNFSFDLADERAWSYGWWLFARRDSNGKLIFNNYGYSNTTRKHQAKARLILDRTPDLTLKYTNKSLLDLESALNDEVEAAQAMIRSIEREMNKPRTQKAKNIERMNQIKVIQDHIKTVETFIKE